MYRILVRLLLSNPTILFGTMAVAIVVVSIVALVMFERRARAMALVAEDDDMKSSQTKRIASVSLVAVGLIAFAAWWVFLRVHTEPDRVLVAIRVEENAGDEDNQWWHGHEGAAAVAGELALTLGEVGLDVVEVDPDGARRLAWAQSSEASLMAAGRRTEARWVIDGRVTPTKTIPLPGSSQRDFVLDIEVSLLDAQTGERFEVPDMPVRAFLWGDTVDAAVQLNGTYVASRLTMPLVAALAEREPLQPYREKNSEATIDENLRADRLAKLFARQSDHASALAMRDEHVQQAEDEEPAERSKVPRARIGGVLAEEFVIGTASDGRLVLHVDPKHVGASPEKVGYVVTNEGENFTLADANGANREVLFEHYNIYGVPSVSRDGSRVWVVLANHGASKSMGFVDTKTGAFTQVANHETEYYAVPTPSPDGTRAVFLRRPDRHGSSALEVIDDEGGFRISLAKPSETPGSAVWSADGKKVYAALMSPTPTIVEIDLSGGPGQEVRTLLLGESAEARLARLEHEAAVREARDTLAAIDEGLVSAADFDVEVLRELAAEAEAEAEDAAVPEDPEQAALLAPDPVTTSSFIGVDMNFDGSALFVIEVTHRVDGAEQRVVGRFDLASRTYERLAALHARRIIASPTADRVAVVVSGHAASGTDSARHDDEILVLGPSPEDRLLVTDNDVDDEVTAWSRDGKQLFSFQRGDDPGSHRTPVARIYRHDLP